MSVNEKEFRQKLRGYSRDTIQLIESLKDRRVLQALHIVNNSKTDTEEEVVQKILRLKEEKK